MIQTPRLEEVRVQSILLEGHSFEVWSHSGTVLFLTLWLSMDDTNLPPIPGDPVWWSARHGAELATSDIGDGFCENVADYQFYTWIVESLENETDERIEHGNF